MSQFRSIDIDFEIHKLIEHHRENFSETPNDVLRRILHIGPPKSLIETAPISEGRAWSDEGITLPHGTLLQMSYNGRTYTGQILDGKWIVEGRVFSSPSGAASEIAITRNGGKTRLDGWKYWKCKLPGHEGWTSLANMRPSLTLKDLGL